jgi:hypothetical protein
MKATIQKLNLEIKWALIFACTTLIWMFLELLLGFHDVHIEKNSIITNFFIIPAIVIFVFAFREKRLKAYNGIITYKQALIFGVIISLMIALLSPLVQYITSIFITPHYFENAKAFAIASKEMTVEKANDYFNLQNYLMASTIGSLVMGVATSAILAIFSSRKGTVQK